MTFCIARLVRSFRTLRGVQLLEVRLSRLLVTSGFLPIEFVEKAYPSDLPGFARADILLVDGRIEAVLPAGQIVGHAKFDANGQIVLPGFIDFHVHGGAGCDTMDASTDSLATMARFFAEHGVTGFTPTTMTATHDDTLAAVRAVSDYTADDSPARAHASWVFTWKVRT